MQKVSRALSIALLLLFIASALLLASLFGVTGRAEAETVYNLGEGKESITLHYGDTPAQVVKQMVGYANRYFKIVSYSASATQGGAASSLLEGDKVTAVPGTYYMVADGNALPCDVTGEVLSDHVCSGTILVYVMKKDKTVTLPAASLEKVYGAEGEHPTWSEGDLTVSFDSEGLAAAAHAGAYDLSVSTVTLSGANVKEYYDIKAKVAESGETARYTVTPKLLTVTYDAEDEVRFNDYLLSDGVSVTTRALDGENGDRIVGYFRLKGEAPALLAVGASYEVELWRYEILPAAGETQSFAAEELSDYSLGAAYSVSTVKAKAGEVILYQDESLLAERQGDPSYLYLPLSTFTMPYLDETIKDYEGEILLAGVTFYPGVTGSIRCSVKGAEAGNIPVGSYPLICISCTCDEIESLSFDDSVRLVVEKRVLTETFSEKEEREITLSNSFVKRVVRIFEGKPYAFDLTADLTGGKVGDEIPYSSAEALTDPNVTLLYGDARVVLIKRTSGVSLRGAASVTAAYGVPYGALAAPYLGDEVLAEERVEYRYRASGSSALNDGLPSAIGSYLVTCSLLSDDYQADPIEVSLTITKRRVAVLYYLTSATKTYGTAFAFKTGETLELRKVYPIDPITGEANREEEILFKAGDFSGTLLSSEGRAADASVGSYPFLFSGAASAYYDIVKGLVYDVAKKTEVTAFTVVKALAPAVPSVTYTVSGREIRVAASGSITAQILTNADMSASTELTGTDDITFRKIGKKELVCGQVYYLRVRANKGNNYENDSAWSALQGKAIAFPALTVTLAAAWSESATFAAEALENAVEGYTVRHRVGSSGEWTDGLSVTGLKPNTTYTLFFRAEKDGVIGSESSLTVRTLRAAVEEKKLEITVNRLKGTLAVATAESGLEYCLCDASGEVISDWSDTASFEALAEDSVYLLKVRYVGEGDLASSEEQVIEIDTHEVKEPFTVKGLLRDWFLAFVGGGLVALTVLFVIVFAKKKKRADGEEIRKK